MKTKLLLALSLVLLTSFAAEARMRGVGGGSGMSGGAMSFTLAGDGTLITVRTTGAVMSGNPTMEVVAVRPNGTERWNWDTTTPVHQIEVTSTHVLVATVVTQSQQSPFASELVALNLADGSEAWRRAIPGAVMQFEATTDVIYVLVTNPFGTPASGGGSGGNHGGGGNGGGPMMGERKLLGVSHSGQVAWELDLAN